MRVRWELNALARAMKAGGRQLRAGSVLCHGAGQHLIECPGKVWNGPLPSTSVPVRRLSEIAAAPPRARLVSSASPHSSHATGSRGGTHACHHLEQLLIPLHLLRTFHARTVVGSSHAPHSQCNERPQEPQDQAAEQGADAAILLPRTQNPKSGAKGQKTMKVKGETVTAGNGADGSKTFLGCHPNYHTELVPT